jgi:multiple sugar transport system ATP-binding protein
MFRQSSTAPPDADGSPTHRRADLILEIDPNAGLETGAKVHLTVDTTHLHIFDNHGHRIDRPTR